MNGRDPSDHTLLWWFLTTCVVGLMPFWLPTFGQYYLNEFVALDRVFRFGAFLLFSHTISLQVLREKIGEQRRRWEKAGGLYQQHIRGLVEISLLPSFVFTLSLLAFWKILAKGEPSKLVIVLQGLAAALALLYSLMHRHWITRVKREYARSDEARTQKERGYVR